MVDYNILYNDVKNILSEKRFKHSEGVVKRAVEYANVYGVDIKMVKCSAIAHDIAKELSDEEKQEIIQNLNIQLDDIEKINGNLPHAKIGAYICKNDYGFTDDMVNSIMYHTTGRAEMSLLEKIIYLADATEENRKYDDIDYYVNIIKKDIDMGMVEVSKWVLNHLLEKKKVIHLNSVNCYNYYLSEIQKKRNK